MNLYLLLQNDNRGYDTYDSLVVAAISSEDASQIGPSEDYFREQGSYHYDRTWARSPESVKVTLIGVAIEGTERGIILTSFNAG